MGVPQRYGHDAIAGTADPCPCCQGGNGTYRHWHKTKGPAPLLRARHGRSEHDRPTSWCDHFYRLVDPDTDETIYMAEPYRLDDRAFDDFLFLRERGWHVEVTARYARHAPGLSIAVMISRATERADPG